MRRHRPWSRCGHTFIPYPSVSDVVWFLGMVLLWVGVPVLVLARILVGLAKLALPGPAAAGVGSPDGQVPVVRDAVLSPQELEILETVTGTMDSRCPVCATNLGEEDTVCCPRCATVHHLDCWDFNGACAVFGCRAAAPCAAAVLSSSSPSSDFLVLRRRFRRWFWLMRIEWWSLLMLSCVGAAGFFSYGLGMGQRGTKAFEAVGLHLLGAVVLLWLLARCARFRLESSVQRRPSVPPERMADLLRRVEHSRSLPLLFRAVRGAPYVYAVLGGLGVLEVLVGGGGLRAFYPALLLILWGGAFVWLAVWSTARHRAALELVRSRLRGAGPT